MENIKNTMKVCIVGGGSAGWMTATTFCKLLNYDITLVESPDIPNCGVGESTLQFIQKWIDLVGLREYEQKLLVESNGTLKHSIKFTNFLKQNSGGFHYHSVHSKLILMHGGVVNFKLENILPMILEQM